MYLFFVFTLHKVKDLRNKMNIFLHMKECMHDPTVTCMVFLNLSSRSISVDVVIVSLKIMTVY